MDFKVKSAPVVLLDVDNTLYDWLGFFGPAFRALLTRLSELSGVSADQLADEFKNVFTTHGTVEYTFAVQELPSIQKLHPRLSGVDLVNQYRQAIDLFQLRRRRFLRLYPCVMSGLKLIRSLGICVFAVTDAQRFHVGQRLNQLKLAEFFDGIFCVDDHETIPDKELAKLRRHSPERYSVKIGREIILPKGLRKPDKSVLTWVVKTLDVEPDLVVYIGDSLVKDIQMAKEAGIYDCWAAYGARYSALDMDTLVRVTHWDKGLVDQVINLTPEDLGISPSFIANSFSQIVQLVTRPRRLWPPRIQTMQHLVAGSEFEATAESVGKLDSTTESKLDAGAV